MSPIETAIKNLSRKRLIMMAANLLYFLALLIAGVALFLVGIGPMGYMVAGILLAVYLLLVRPLNRRYIGCVRGAILTYAVCACLDQFEYSPKDGVDQAAVLSGGLGCSGSGRAFLSRELVRGQMGDIQVELADVTFPVVENGLNAMLSGCYIRITYPGIQFVPLWIEGEEMPELPKQEKKLIKQIGSMAANGLFLCIKGDRLELILRGRFLGYRINPLMPITERSITYNPLPELGWALQLVRLHKREEL